MYKLVLLDKAEKELNNIDFIWQKRILEKLELLKLNPEMLKNNIKPLLGIKKDLFRLRVGRYRVVYIHENENLTIVIIRIAKREDIYKLIR